MPELVDQMYCSQQIVIPPKFPYLLKRYCKAAIKTQPYDLLRWSFEYFKALADRRPPPVKLRLEYPVYSTEGGLTRGCLKVLANQLAGQQILPLADVKAAWQGFCLDPEELRRIFCLCEVYQREENIQFLHFIAVAGGLLTKTLTHTMILLCDTLTKEPDGGSAAICVHDFLIMYKFLAAIDASKDVRYINGYREGWEPPPEVESTVEEEEEHLVTEMETEDDYWHTSSADLQRLLLIDDSVSRTARLSVKLNMPLLGKIERSPSAERAGEIERENYMRDWTAKAKQDDEIDNQLRQISAAKMGSSEAVKEEGPKVEVVKAEQKEQFEIYAFDEDDKPLSLHFFGEHEEVEDEEDEDPYNVENAAKSQKSVVLATSTKSNIAQSKTAQSEVDAGMDEEQEAEATVEAEPTEKQKLQIYVDSCYEDREERRQNLECTFDEIANLVDRFKSASYDLGMVAGRQMSITSGEFIVHHIEKEILEYIDEQIAILPDPDLKKKKAKPEEVRMIRDMLAAWLEENMELIAPEVEEVEEEEEEVPEVTTVFAVPGIGPPVDDDTVHVFEEYAFDVSKVQADVFMPRNLRHFMCPPLEKYIECSYDEDTKSRKEEIPTGGIITD